MPWPPTIHLKRDGHDPPGFPNEHAVFLTMNRSDTKGLWSRQEEIATASSVVCAHVVDRVDDWIQEGPDLGQSFSIAGLADDLNGPRDWLGAEKIGIGLEVVKDSLVPNLVAYVLGYPLVHADDSLVDGHFP